MYHTAVFVHVRNVGDKIWHEILHQSLNKAVVRATPFTLRLTKSWLARAASQAFTPTVVKTSQVYTQSMKTVNGEINPLSNRSVTEGAPVTDRL